MVKPKAAECLASLMRVLAKQNGWISLKDRWPPKNLEVEFFSKCGMQTKGKLTGGKGWIDGPRTDLKLYPGDYLVAWRPA